MASITPLLSVLKFKNLIAELNDNEFVSFLTEFSKSIGREEMIQSLCTQFAGSTNSNMTASNQNVNGMNGSDDDILNPLTTMSNIASHIIRSRDTGSNPLSLSNINDLPSSMVGEVASYLDQKSYAALSRSNRKLFVDTNSPNRLSRISLRKMKNGSVIQIQKYSRVRFLRFNLKNISKIQPFDEAGARFAGLNQLETLKISGRGSTVHDLDEFINNSSPCFGSVSSLVLRGFEERSPVNADKLMRILSKFSGLTHLRLFAVCGSGLLSSNQLSSICPNLLQSEFLFPMAPWIPTIAESFCSRLESMSIHLPPRMIINASNYDFSNLRRLCLYPMEIEQINSFLNISKTLQEISWFPNAGTLATPILDAQHVQDTVRQCIVDQTLLEYLHVSTRGHFAEICSGIHLGLFVTKKCTRDLFEIALDVDVREITIADDFICRISKIIHVLSIGGIKEWMITIDAHLGKVGQQVFDWEPIAIALNGVLSEGIQLQRTNAYSFAIMNENKMKRHKKWWSKSGAPPFY